MKYKSWTQQEVNILNQYKEAIVRESGGDKISEATSQTLHVVFNMLPERTPAAIVYKLRTMLVDEGVLIPRKQQKKMEQASSAVMVSIPLSKLYGKIDFETFMSLINE